MDDFKKFVFFCVFIFLYGFPSGFAVTADSSTSECSADKLIVYKLVLHTFWTSSRFPKHYPQWRPPAQWSKLIGRSHGKTYYLFRIGKKSSNGMKTFAETGKDDNLNNIGQGENDVYDVFNAPAITTGSGRTETQFMVDGNHSLVSVVSRIIPSPDWFIGVDSFNLCVNGNWLDSITIEGDPMDAGTDNGFTFTAPNWPTQPQGVVFRMSSKYPSHPAGSFFYPQLKRLPPIATFQFIKIRAYDLSEVFYRTEDEKQYEVFKITDHQKDNQNSITSNEVDQEIEGQRLEQEIRLKSELAKNGTFDLPSITTSKNDLSTLVNDEMSNSILTGFFNDAQIHQYNKLKKKKKRYYRDCKVSDWGEWSSCNATCGVGEMNRKREVIKYPKGKGEPCPPLTETRWCKNSATCNDSILFKW
ncbi:spondin-2 [Planococcus citri]|uniref:spondin-2 n=1 Tax=Planococcus citri TaxID=170843 RepID=UPI0031F93E91